MKLTNLAFALAIGAATLTATVTTADAYWPSQYCRHHMCARPHSWGHHWHCRWSHGRKRCWR